MAEFRHVRRITVSLWGRTVGTIVPVNGHAAYAFKFDPAFCRTGIEIAPLFMPLRREPYIFPDLPRSDYSGLPPVFADSLPDGFGRGLIERYLLSKGFDRREITPLDQLAYVGKRAMGALTYEPDHSPSGRPTALDMRELVEEARLAVNQELTATEGIEALRTIIRIGSTAGGAQAKALVGWNRETNAFCFGDRNLPQGFEHWIIKFTPRDFPWRGRCEYALYKKAKKAGLSMSESTLIEIDGIAHFMTRRFDRTQSTRHHLLSLSAMAHFPMSVHPEFRTYEQFLATVHALSPDWNMREEAFKRMAFNVLCGECDDHTRNFSFLLKEGGNWELAPAYDLTGADFPSSDPWSSHIHRHQLSVNGKFSSITDADLLTVAERFGIGTAGDILEEMKHAL